MTSLVSTQKATSPDCREDDREYHRRIDAGLKNYSRSTSLGVSMWAFPGRKVWEPSTEHIALEMGS